MHVEIVRLTDLRNYEKLDFRPSNGLNLLVGPNAQGKSGILEAVYMLATSKSNRTFRDTELIRIGQESAHISAQVARETQNDVALEIVLSRAEKKTVKIDTVKHGRIGDLIGQLNAVIFSTADVEMVKGEPALRRRLLDLEISQISPRYVHAIGRYKRVLEQRNSLLREVNAGGPFTDGLEVWDRQLAEYGAVIVGRRAEFVEFLSTEAARQYGLLTDGAEDFRIAYKSSVAFSPGAAEEEMTQVISAALGERRESDLARGITSVGPHRDDLTLTISGLPAREFGSQGQQKTAAVAIKLAEIELIRQSVGEYPVVLLDDVTAELDEVRRARAIEQVVGKCQTLVTTTSLGDLDAAVAAQAAVFEVRSGTVKAA